MKINAQSTLTVQDVRDAINLARTPDRGRQDIYLHEADTGKRGAVTFYCNSAHGRYATQGNRGRAATWTAWGWVIAELFARDPSAHIGQYCGMDDFTRQIGDARERYYLRQSLGIRGRNDEPGENIDFLYWLLEQ